MRLLYVAPEVTPFVTASDLGELVAEVAQAQRHAGLQVHVVTPFRCEIDPDRFGIARRLEPLEVAGAGASDRLVVLEGRFPASDARVHFIDHPLLREPDQAPAQSWFLFARAVVQFARMLDQPPEVVHGFGWQTGPLPLLIRLGHGGLLASATRVFSVLDPARRGLFPAQILDELGIGRELFHPEGIEFHQQVSLLKAALTCSERIVVPGPSALAELQTEALGFGLHGLYRHLAARITGVLGGVSPSSYDPADHRLPERFGADDLTGKAACKRAAQLALGLEPEARRPLLLVAGPLLDAGGVEVLIDASDAWLGMPLQLALVGACSEGRAARLAALAADHPQSVAFGAAASPATERLLLAGADALVLPAEHETGSLIQLKALRYGTVPVVSAIGSLADSVVEFDAPSLTGTGLTFREPAALLGALSRLLAIYEHRERWTALVNNAMRQQFSWKKTALRLCQVYSEARSTRAPTAGS